MRNIMKLAIGTVIALSPASAAVAKSDSSCYDAYGYYGYSFAYCEHSSYGRATPADRYYGQDRERAWRDRQESERLADREQYSDQPPGYAVRDGGDSKQDVDRDRDRDTRASGQLLRPDELLRKPVGELE